MALVPYPILERMFFFEIGNQKQMLKRFLKKILFLTPIENAAPNCLLPTLIQPKFMDCGMVFSRLRKVQN
jgi:hypothetical protein